MTPEQETALKFHCRLACETMNPKLQRLHQIWPRHSLILSVNSGYE
jgi:hypothetical protein